MSSLADPLPVVLDQLTQRGDFLHLVHGLVGIAEEERRLREEFRRDLDGKYRHAEFINGQIVYQDETMKYRHKEVIECLYDVGKAYVRRHSLGKMHCDGLLIKAGRNDYKPDVYFWPRQTSDRFERGQEIFPPPTFVAEVLSPSTARRDRGVKFLDYAAHGVREYWLIDPEDERVEIYDAEGESFRRRETLTAAGGGTLRSATIDGFVIPVAALFDDAAAAAALGAINAATA